MKNSGSLSQKKEIGAITQVRINGDRVFTYDKKNVVRNLKKKRKVVTGDHLSKPFFYFIYESTASGRYAHLLRPPAFLYIHLPVRVFHTLNKRVNKVLGFLGGIAFLLLSPCNALRNPRMVTVYHQLRNS